MNPPVNRLPTRLIRLAAVLAFGGAALTVCAYQLRYTPIWEQFLAARASGDEPMLPDFSYAGYRYCEEPIPDVSLPVFDVTRYGAVPDDGKSDQAAIQAAIQAAEAAGGGIVSFPRGRFLVNMAEDPHQPIRLSGARIVLRGSGSKSGGTAILMEKPLDPLDPDAFFSTPYMFSWSPPHTTGRNLTTVTSDAARETFWIEVRSAEELSVGQWITLHIRNRDIFDRYLAPYKAATEWKNGLNISERHRIAAIDGNQIRLREPVHIEIRARDGWIVREFPVIEEVGIEDIRFIGKWREEFKHHASARDDAAWSAIEIHNAVDSWIRHCQFINWNRSIQLISCSAFSVLNVTFDGNPGHYGIHTRSGTGVLVGASRDRAGHYHGPSVGYSSSSTVFWRFRYPGGSSFDGHSGCPYATLLDNVSGGINYRRSGGGIKNLPNHLRYLVLWNFNNTGTEKENYTFWRGTYDTFVQPIVVGLHGNPISIAPGTAQIIESLGDRVQPESLFEGQLAARLGKTPGWLAELARSADP